MPWWPGASLSSRTAPRPVAPIGTAPGAVPSDVADPAILTPMRSLPALALLLVLAACDSVSSPDGGLVANTFTIQVGDGPVETRGEAHIGTYESAVSGGTVALLLGARPLSGPLSLSSPAIGFAYDGVTVAPGTYALAAVNPDGLPPEAAFIGVYIDPERTAGGQPGRAGFYYTGEGTLTLDSLDTERALGSFAMRALELGADSQPTGSEVEVRGTFHALRTDAFGDEDAFWR